MAYIIVFGIALLLVSGALMLSHILAWQNTKEDAQDERELRFAWRRCRRRLQASGMIGAVGVLVCFHRLVPLDPVLVTGYFLALLGLVVWIMLLAAGDAMETRMHYRQTRHQHWTAETKFASELRAGLAANQQSDDAEGD